MLINKAIIKGKIREILSLDSHPAHISAGFAVGVFISFTPPVPGLHTLLALAVAFVFRLNKVTCIAGTWVNSLITIVPSMIFAYMLGAWLLGVQAVELQIESLDWPVFKQVVVEHAKPLLLGCSVMGFVAAVAAYFACYWGVLFFRRKDAALLEKTREMEQVGEELK